MRISNRAKGLYFSTERLSPMLALCLQENLDVYGTTVTETVKNWNNSRPPVTKGARGKSFHGSMKFSRALIENDSLVLSVDEISSLLKHTQNGEAGFVEKTFRGIYFTAPENR